MEPHSTLLAAAGGLLIGTAAALLLVVSGRVAGVSGMAAAAAGIASGGTPRSQAGAFVAGLPIGAAAVAAFARTPDLQVTSSVPLLIGAGLLVGFGSRLGNGCTSGHGVCGLARLSLRSIAATAAFLIAGFATVFVVRHLVAS